MNSKLVSHIRNNNKILVAGLEGCGKSRYTIDTILNSDIIDFRYEYVI